MGSCESLETEKQSETSVLRKRKTVTNGAEEKTDSTAENVPESNTKSMVEKESVQSSSLVFGYLNLISDGVHNFTDGMALGSAFLLYGSVGGWSRTLFLLAHELPQEIGDFGILVRSGFSVSKALFFNFLSALVALAGTALALSLGQDPGQSSLIEGFTAGGFIYIAVGVMAEMNNGISSLKNSALQLTSLNSELNNKSKGEMNRLKGELIEVDAVIDKGNASDENIRKRSEIINSMVSMNNIKTSEAAQKAKIKCKRFGKPQEDRASISMNFPNVLSNEQAEDLECDVTNEEVKRAVWDCGTDKSPGLDGFTFGFFRKFWEIIDSDVPEAVKSFFSNGVIPKGCNSSFIALIPKVPGANMVKDFRPISLIGSIYKIIAKIMANHLVGVLGDIVSEVQSAFIADRQILDGPFILNEGDPLSPLLFILVMESLHLSFQRVVDAGQWNDGNIDILVNVLECFHRVSGLKINMSKSKIMGIHVERDLVKHAAFKLGCLTLNTPFVYLGTKVGGKMSRAQEWNEVVKKVKSRIKRAIWIKLSSVMADKLKGGLGVASLYALNRGLLIKWLWRFYSKKLALWVRVVKAIHGEDGNVGSKVLSSTRSCWLNIVNEIRILSAKGIHVMDFVRHKWGNGESTLFWEDIWFNRCVLKEEFPRLYALESSKKGGGQYDMLSELVRDIVLAPISDRYNWSLEGSGNFSVVSIRREIDDNLLPTVSCSTRWVKYVPIKVNIFA
uniref:IAA-alanine resistance protein 1 n=1 Tax=Tanacetum cinerariifolium TaxID=118510 RepID=A0A6L2LI80_TANCI|nr:IAA-alanine resistance protein 1 [Tanacetum cinerariifolium]